MCGRYTLTDPGKILLDHFQLPALPVDYRPRYNIAPSQEITAIIMRDGERRIGSLRWGLIPSWAKDPNIGHRMINARAETVAEKPAFRAALRRRRCLIPADGFYEWEDRGGRKQPVRFIKSDGGVFAFAGIWETWRPQPVDKAQGELWEEAEEPDEPIYSCAIVTTEANAFVGKVHHRMPVILPPELYDAWLDPKVQSPEELLPLLRSPEDGGLRAYEVSSVVNSARNEGPACIEALAETDNP